MRMRRLHHSLLPVSALALLLLPSLALAEDEEGGGGDYSVLYFLTEAASNGASPARGRQMTALDMQYFMNQARCSCGQAIRTRINLLNQASATNDLTNAYVGQSCDTAQSGNVPQFTPCAQIQSGFPDFYSFAPEINVDPVFFGWGVDPSGPQTIESAEPVAGCYDRTGDSGVWMCASQTSCNEGQFFMSGDSSVNATGFPSVTFDYLPPAVKASDFEVFAGDGAVKITWNLQGSGDVYGFRVLCADENDQPLPGRGTSGPSA
ncbi:MAG: hypothetical protein ACPHRO_14500, partial [Nannocystaceae bacterium]